MNRQIEKYLNQNKSLSFKELLFSYIDDSNLKDSTIYNKVHIDRRLFSKIRCNNSYIPSKFNIIKLCISLTLNIEDTNKLLSTGGYILSTNNNVDLIIKYFIENNIYDINVINNYLYDLTNTTL